MIEDRLQTLAFPDRDVSLAALISLLSEPDAGRAADNFVSNEDSYPRVASELERRAPRDAVYLGVGPDQNFSLIARARPRLAFILDFRRRNLRLHLIHKALITLSPDRATYLTRLTARKPNGRISKDTTASELVEAFANTDMDRARLAETVAEVRGLLEPFGILADAEWADLATIQAKLAGPGLNARFLALPMYPPLSRLITTRDTGGKPGHWLASESTYGVVRSLESTDRVVPVVGDFAGPKSLPEIGRWLERHSLSVGVLYLSDVEFFLLRSGKFARWVANLGGLPLAPGAILIRTSTREIKHPARVSGDSSTTLIQPIAPFLEAAKAGKIRSPDDLFPVP